MRVALIHNVLAGGGFRRMREQITRLDAEVVEFCLAGAAHVTGEPRETPYRQWASRAPRAARPPLRYADLFRLRTAWRELSSRVDDWRPDVVLANSCRFLQAPLALLWVAAPTVYFCDEPRRVYYEPEAAATRNPWTRGLYSGLYSMERRLDRGAVASADVLVGNSEYGARQIAAAYGRPVTTVAMGVSDFFSPGVPRVARRHVLSVGTLIPGKGHDLVIEACASSGCGRPVMVVAPRPSPQEAERLRGIAARLGVDLEIRVAISDDDLREAYRTAFATLYLSRMEPLGLASLEAQACGSPVVVSDEGGLPETLGGHRGGGWAVPRDAESAAARLRELAEPAVWERASAGASEVGRERSWERSARHLGGILQDACAASRTPMGRAS